MSRIVLLWGCVKGSYTFLLFPDRQCVALEEKACLRSHRDVVIAEVHEMDNSSHCRRVVVTQGDFWLHLFPVPVLASYGNHQMESDVVTLKFPSATDLKKCLSAQMMER
jgi:hypothetical protein